LKNARRRIMKVEKSIFQISTCLAEYCCRYDGKYLLNKFIKKLVKYEIVLAAYPEKLDRSTLNPNLHLVAIKYLWWPLFRKTKTWQWYFCVKTLKK